MTISKFRTLQDAQQAQWSIKTDRKYYQKLQELFNFYSRLFRFKKSPNGPFRYKTFKEAAAQESDWKIKWRVIEKDILKTQE